MEFHLKKVGIQISLVCVTPSIFTLHCILKITFNFFAKKLFLKNEEFEKIVYV